ncbi:MAG TPA: hypothetical protein VGB17_10230 [Pyrinomonadaceae bacterium]|jgi:hypothetical protein
MKEALSRQALTTVLIVVLLWYTFFSPAPAFVRSRGREETPPDAEDRRERLAESRDVSRIYEIDGRPGAPPIKTPQESVDDLDWPDIIGA